MRGSIAQGLAMVLLIASSGAAQGPTSSGSANTRNLTSPPAKPAGVKAKSNQTHPFQVGTASWYGQDFVGKPTASGEPYNMYDLTAAHPALPLGSYVKVTNLRNRKSVVVRINDRGPIIPGRIIDLSYSAAHALQMNKSGVQRVRLDVVHPEVVAELHTPVAY
jgi:rare lipoprotein A